MQMFPLVCTFTQKLDKLKRILLQHVRHLHEWLSPTLGVKFIAIKFRKLLVQKYNL